MSCMLGCSNGTVAIATAMVFSSTALFLTIARHGNQTSKIPDQTQGPILRSCLSSEKTKKQRKKKRVRFAENVKETKGNGKEYRRRELSRRIVPDEPVTKPENTDSICRISSMPANRMALYNGILRDRGHRIQWSY